MKLATSKLASILAAVTASGLAGAACSHHDTPEIHRTQAPQHRVIESPPAASVRALPPHAIRADGVGPYRLGESLAELVDELPSGPRIALFEIPGVVHRSVLRADDDAILIGGEPLGKASSVAVVGGDVARTESGIHVGSTRDELVRALGAPVDDPERALDPRVVVPSSMPNARVLLDGDRVVALVVEAPPAAPHTAAADNGCVRPADDPDRHQFGACLSAAGETVEVDGDDLSVRAADVERLIATVRVPGLSFAAALRRPGETRDDLVAIATTDDGQTRTWTLYAYRLEGTRLTKAVDPTPVYVVTAANARWIGSELRYLDLYLELTSSQSAIEVGGLLTTRIADKMRDIVAITPVPVTWRRAKSAAQEAADSTAEPGSDAGSDRRTH